MFKWQRLVSILRLRRNAQQKMRPIPTHVAWSVYVSVCLLGMSVSCAKAEKPIEMPFEVWTCMGPRSRVLVVCPDPPTTKDVNYIAVTACQTMQR